MNESLLYNKGRKLTDFGTILKEVQNYMSSQYASILSENPEEEKEQVKSYISKFLLDTGMALEGHSREELVYRLYEEMAGFSFLGKYLDRNDVEEININSWEDIKITYNTGEIIATEERFLNPEHALDVIRRMLHKSGMILDNSQPMVCGYLGKNKRVTAYGRGVIDDDAGVVVSIRIVNPLRLSKEAFIQKETATDEMLTFLSNALRYGASMCITGATSSGKTTIMSWLLSTVPEHMRIFTMENGVREFDLVKRDTEGKIINNVIHTVTRLSEDESKNITLEKLLEKALTTNPDLMAVGEMKGAESYYATEAARTGHIVITTTHANSCVATYYRMMSLCKMKYTIDDDTLYTMVTEAFPIIVFCKRLEDNSRKITEILECEIGKDNKRTMRTLYRYHTVSNEYVDGKMQVNGYFEKVSGISESMKHRFIESGMPMGMAEEMQKVV